MAFAAPQARASSSRTSSTRTGVPSPACMKPTPIRLRIRSFSLALTLLVLLLACLAPTAVAAAPTAPARLLSAPTPFPSDAPHPANLQARDVRLLEPRLAVPLQPDAEAARMGKKVRRSTTGSPSSAGRRHKPRFNSKVVIVPDLMPKSKRAQKQMRSLFEETLADIEAGRL